jgi:DNA-directed RNA polymerase alpha subunit
MEYTILQNENNKITCQLTAPNYQVANIFRRIIMGDIPTIAIDIVNVYENTSHYHDEYLAHRLGLVPLKYKSDYQDVILEIDVHATTEVRNVTTKDLKGKVYPVDNDILICKLFPGQSLHLKCTVKEGTGNEHAKWSPVTIITFKKQDKIYFFEIESIGMIPGNILVKTAFEMMKSQI